MGSNAGDVEKVYDLRCNSILYKRKEVSSIAS